MYIDVHAHVYAHDSLKAGKCPDSEKKTHHSWYSLKKTQQRLCAINLPHLLPDAMLGIIGRADKTDACVLLALDHIYDVQNGSVIKCDSDSELYVSNDYVCSCVETLKTRYEKTAYMGASIHPARPDAIQELEKAYNNGAVLVKWIPSTQNIDLASYENDQVLKDHTHAFYKRMAELGIPLLCHLGREHTIPPAFHDDAKQEFNNPELLKPLLDIHSENGKKLKVIGAHCAMPLTGDPELATLQSPEQITPHMKIFLDMLQNGKYDNLYTDLSAFFLYPSNISFDGRRLESHMKIIRKLALRPEFKDKFLFGSDFPSLSSLLSSTDLSYLDPLGFLRSLLELNPIDRNVLNFINYGFPEETLTNAQNVLRIPDTAIASPVFKCVISPDAAGKGKLPTVNAHTHIANFSSIFSRAAFNLCRERIRSKLPGGLFRLTDDSGKFLDDIENTVYNDTDIPVTEKSIFKLAELAGEDSEEKCWLSLRNLLSDVHHQTAYDFMAFVRKGLSSITANADDLVESLADNEIAIIHTLNFLEAGESDERYVRQLDDTVLAVFDHPGRLLPFYAVNSHQENWLEKAKTVFGSGSANEYEKYQGAFVGIKLYPSSGYKLEGDEWAEFFRFCEEQTLPITIHCNNGGFSKRSAIAYCSPAELGLWLEKYPNLKLCFAHFGGDEELCQEKFPESGYSSQICNLMSDYPNVYADISYHDSAMADKDCQESYFDHLKDILKNDEKRKNRIMFGSDFYMIRMRARNKNYTKYFREHLGADLFKLVSRDNPLRFLQFDSSPTINKHLQFLKNNKDKLKRQPASWTAIL